MEDDFLKGLEHIENQFTKLIKKAENDFDVKHSKLKVIYRKLYRNYSFMTQLHDRKLNELESIDHRVKREKDVWDLERMEIGGLVKTEDEIIKLDVGGARLKVSQETLCQVPGSLLAKMFSGKHESLKVGGNDVVYLDRDFKTFDAMVKYLRNNRKVYPVFVQFFFIVLPARTKS